MTLTENVRLRLGSLTAGGFRSVVVAREKRVALDARIARLQAQSRTFWLSGQSRFNRRILAADCDGLLLVYLYKPGSRPMRSELAIVTRENRVLLPGMSALDFLGAVRVMGLEDLQAIAAFYDLSKKGYGVSEKGALPQRIEGEADAAALGIEMPTRLPALDDSVSLWWQKWGGELFTFHWDPVAEPPVIEKKVVRRYAGSYSPDPTPRL